METFKDISDDTFLLINSKSETRLPVPNEYILIGKFVHRVDSVDIKSDGRMNIGLVVHGKVEQS